MNALKRILHELIQRQSITPDDADCQTYMIKYLERLGFVCQRFNQAPVANFFARLGSEAPLLLFAGHTDVVPVGDRSKWLSDPFCLDERDGFFYGRGVADMKGSLACMLLAATRFVEERPMFTGSIGFLITSGEEGDFFTAGTPHVMHELTKQGIKPDFCIVGEPSSSNQVGDVIKIGRRGSLTGKLRVFGVQGHVAYPHLAINPIHAICPALNELINTRWDDGTADFPPTSLQITQIQSGGEASNIIPGELLLDFNFRYSTMHSALQLQRLTQECFDRHNLTTEIQWHLNGEPFLTKRGPLTEYCIKAIKKHTGLIPEFSTSGGTSDARFIAPFGIDVIELGPVNKTIHQINECVLASDLDLLTKIYYDIMINV